MAGSQEYTDGPTDAECPDCGAENEFTGQNSHSDVICIECGWYAEVWRYDGR